MAIPTGLIIAIVIAIAFILIVGVVVAVLLISNSRRNIPTIQPTVISEPGTPPILSAPYQLPPSPPAQPVITQTEVEEPPPMQDVQFTCIDQEDCPDNTFCANGQCVPF